MHNIFGIKGNIIYTKSFGDYEVHENSIVVVEDKKVIGIYKNIPKQYKDITINDYKDSLIIPGFVDLHFHAPQYANLGLGLDKELMPWLTTYTFPEEAKFSNLEYAHEVYSSLVKEMWRIGTTRSVIFGTIHRKATELLMDIINKAGLCAFVGKVNMDRNAPENIIEPTQVSLIETEKWLQDYVNKYENVKPIITPRFVPTCTYELMKGLGQLASKYNVGVQSHLSENYGEIKIVRQLHPDIKDYASVYQETGLLGNTPTLMAHCIHMSDHEIELMVKNKVYMVHCPNSNSNLASGMAPVRKLIDRGIPVGLGSDISGGHTLSMTDVIVSSAQVSNLKWLESNKAHSQLTTAELFYLATKGGGSYFGHVGSFEEGYEFDALIIDDNELNKFKKFSLPERLQKFIYTGDDRNILHRYVAGELINEPEL